MLLANTQLKLIGEKSFRIAFVFYQKMNKMLAHPLLRRQRHIAATQKVEDLAFSIPFTQFYFIRGKVYFHLFCIFADAKVQKIFQLTNGRE